MDSGPWRHLTLTPAHFVMHLVLIIVIIVIGNSSHGFSSHDVIGDPSHGYSSHNAIGDTRHKHQHVLFNFRCPLQQSVDLP